MNNREIFDCVDKFVKDKFCGKFKVRVFNIYDNFTILDNTEMTIEKVSPDGINEIVYHTNFLNVGKEIEQVGVEKYLNNLENFLNKKI